MNPEELVERLEWSEVPKRYRNCRFENFDSYTAKLARNVALVQQLSSERRSLLIFGPVGSGKTHLGVAALVPFLSREARCVFVGAADFVHRVQSAYGNAKEVARELIDDRHVILLDDVGAERGTETARAALLYLVDQIYIARKRIIVTTNLTPKELYSFEARTMSRLGELCALVELAADDYRLRSAAQRHKADRCKAIASKTVN